MYRVTVSVLLGVVVAFLSVGPTWVSGQESPQVSPQRGWGWGWGRGKGRGRGRLACAEVVEELTPCTSYLQGYRSSPSKQCCDGVAELLDRNDTSTAYEWDTTCWCIKKTLHGIWRYDPSLISRLPGNCSSSDDNKPDGGDTTESDNDDNGGDTTESEDDGPENQELVENQNGTDTDSDSDSGTDTDSGTDSDTDDDIRAANSDGQTESDTESDNDDNGGGGNNNDDRFNCFWLSEQDKLTLGLKE